MQEILINKLHHYILQNNPDLLIKLKEQNKVEKYLKEKISSVEDLLMDLLAENIPGYIIEERCMEIITEDLRPSKFTYLISLLEEEFEREYLRLKAGYMLSYEIVNLIELCNLFFEATGFTEDNENDEQLRSVITGVLQEYFEEKR